MVLRRGFSFRESALHQHVDHAAVFCVHTDRAAVFSGPQQRLENASVVEHENAWICHEQLEGGHSLAYERIHLGFRPVVQVGDDHVEAVVDHRLALGLFHPRFPGVMKRLAAVLNGEIDDRRRPAEGRCSRPAFEIVRRRRAAERHVEMRVNVDAARQDKLARRVDHFVGVCVDPRSDQRDPLLLDQHVAVVLIDSRDDGAALD